MEEALPMTCTPHREVRVSGGLLCLDCLQFWPDEGQRPQASYREANTDSALVDMLTAPAREMSPHALSAIEHYKKVRPTGPACGCPERICLLCGRTEPCGLKYPDDETGSLVCMFDPTYQELCERLRVANEDRARLDWLESVSAHSDGSFFLWRGGVLCCGPIYGATLRQAIDTARSAGTAAAAHVAPMAGSVGEGETDK